MGFEIENGVLKKYHEEEGITDIAISDNVTSIEERAFYGCSSLTQITIPDSVTYIGKFAFSGCLKLESVVIKDLCKPLNYDARFPKVFSASVKTLFIEKYKINLLYGENWFPSIIEIINMIRSKEYFEKRPLIYFDGSIRSKYSLNSNEFKSYKRNKGSYVKSNVVLQIFLQSSQPEAEKYIKENLEEVIKAFIRENEYKHLKEILDCDKFTLTYDKITSVLEYAIENTQNGGNVEMQAYLVEYKHKYFSENNLLDNLKLNF